MFFFWGKSRSGLVVGLVVAEALGNEEVVEATPVDRGEIVVGGFRGGWEHLGLDELDERLNIWVLDLCKCTPKPHDGRVQDVDDDELFLEGVKTLLIDDLSQRFRASGGPQSTLGEKSLVERDECGVKPLFKLLDELQLIQREPFVIDVVEVSHGAHEPLLGRFVRHGIVPEQSEDLDVGCHCS